MKVRSVILLALDAFGGKVVGKTLLQKRLYFMSEFVGEDWGYHAHYYGPYSDSVASELVTLKVQGLVDEHSEHYGVVSASGFERKRYDYSLTPSGREAVQWLKTGYREEAERIASAATRVMTGGELDYEDISIAAKAYFILKASGAGTMTTGAVAEKAKEFSWKVTPSQVAQACRFLSVVHLVKTA